MAAVDSLPPKCRETVILYYMNGLSYQDIADFLAISVSTVRGRLENGRRKLKKEMIAMIKEEFVRKVLEGVIRFPLRVQRLDENGHLVGVEKGYPGSQHEPKVLGCLFCAFKMIGHEIPYEQISAASGEAFRFAFEKNWCHEPEYITPVDALARACDILGFEYTSLRNQDLVVSLEAIERSIESGIPALIGMDRCWRLIVGYDKDRGEYYYIGGEWEIYQAKVGEKLSQFISKHLLPWQSSRIRVLDLEGRPIAGADVVVAGLGRSRTNSQGYAKLYIPYEDLYALVVRFANHEEVLYEERISPGKTYVYRAADVQLTSVRYFALTLESPPRTTAAR